jgi:phosphatidylglycerol lysyltransferase
MEEGGDIGEPNGSPEVEDISVSLSEAASRSGEPGTGGGPVLIVSATLFANGLLSILQVLLIRFPRHPRIYGMLLPFGLYHLSKTLTMTIGFMLIYLSLRLLQRRNVAWWIAVFISALAVLTHMGQYRIWYTAVAPALTFLLLLVYRKRFTVRTEPRSIAQGLILVGVCVGVALSYGTLGFWLLDKRDFGIAFSLSDAVVRTLRELTLVGNSDLVPETRHARWFLESFRILGLMAAVFAAYSLFRPVVYRIVTLPHEFARGAQILRRWGRSPYDYFKLWHDKSLFFSGSGEAFISYRVERGVAVCLGDPVGPPEELERLQLSFLRFCIDNGWLSAVLFPDALPMYEKLGYSALKIGESAVVDLAKFAESTARKKYFRYIRRKLEGDGYSLARYRPPVDQSILEEIEDVSREWLTLPGHREFGFLQGNFRRDYLAGTPVTVVRDPAGRVIAFVNEVRSYRPGEATIDMMRHRPGVHWGIMDYLLQGVMLMVREEGYRSFYLGLAGIADNPGPTLVERAIYQISTRFNLPVHAKGVRQFKNKFDPVWEDRHLVYRGTPLSLARIALAVMKIL